MEQGVDPDLGNHKPHRHQDNNNKKKKKKINNDIDIEHPSQNNGVVSNKSNPDEDSESAKFIKFTIQKRLLKVLSSLPEHYFNLNTDLQLHSKFWDSIEQGHLHLEEWTEYTEHARQIYSAAGLSPCMSEKIIGYTVLFVAAVVLGSFDKMVYFSDEITVFYNPEDWRDRKWRRRLDGKLKSLEFLKDSASNTGRNCEDGVSEETDLSRRPETQEKRGSIEEEHGNRCKNKGKSRKNFRFIRNARKGRGGMLRKKKQKASA